MLNQEAVVTKIRVYDMVLDIGQVIHQNIVVRGREEYVGCYGYDKAL
jgi:hypothetical protein